MTEAEWLVGTNPTWMLRWLQTVNVPERKALMFVVAAHRLWSGSDEVLVSALEAYADRKLSYGQLDAVYRNEHVHDGVPFTDFQVENAAYAVPTTKPAWKEAVRFIKDVFGNPFRPVTADPRWLTSTAVSLAQAIYEDRAFDRLPILADALEEAGCNDPDILAHLRGDGPHVRGCWAVDLVLGKQ